MYRLFASCLTLLFAQFSNAAEPVNIECVYKSYSNSQGNHQAEKEFKLSFVLDHEKRTAYMPGEMAGSKVTYLPSNNGLSLIETTTAGNLATTTIDRNNNSVHSRNTIINGILAPSQFYGKCEVGSQTD